MEKSVLLVGGAGFIGSHIAERLVKDDYRVVVVDDLSTGKIGNIEKLNQYDNFEFEKVDIRDFEQLEKLFEKYRPQIVNHHAAQKSVPYSIDDPIMDESINIKGLLNLIVLSGKYKIESFTFASSGGALSGDIDEGEQSVENDTPQLMSPYAISKYKGEKYIKLYSELYGFKYTILRYANVYGPRQIVDGESGVIPIFMNNILEGKTSTLMAYEDMPKGCIRDYIYVSDVVEANMISVKKPLNTVVNIGTGKEISILDVYHILQEKFETDLEIKKVGPRKGDIRRSVLCINKVSELCGWKPKVDIEEGIYKLKEYYKNPYLNKRKLDIKIKV